MEKVFRKKKIEELRSRGYKPYVCGLMQLFVPGNDCLLCRHCTDVFYDYTNGPYMVECDRRDEVPEEWTCDQFELDETKVGKDEE